MSAVSANFVLKEMNNKKTAKGIFRQTIYVRTFLERKNKFRNSALNKVKKTSFTSTQRHRRYRERGEELKKSISADSNEVPTASAVSTSCVVEKMGTNITPKQTSTTNLIRVLPDRRRKSETNYSYHSKEDWVNAFIKAVESRPPLYNRTLNKSSDRHALYWAEVCETVIPNWNTLSSTEKALHAKVVSQKWRNLRTSFKREVNTQQKLVGTPNTYKRRKYIYYDQLKFLLPTLGQSGNLGKQNGTKQSTRKTGGESEKPEVVDDEFEYSNDEEFIVIKDEPEDQQILDVSGAPNLHTTDEGSTQFNVQIAQPQNSFIQCGESIARPHESIPQHQPSISQQPLQNKKEPSFEERLLTVVVEKGNPEEIDDDMLFLLSLVPSFKKMTELQKIEAKIEFLSIIKRMS